MLQDIPSHDEVHDRLFHNPAHRERCQHDSNDASPIPSAIPSQSCSDETGKQGECIDIVSYCDGEEAMRMGSKYPQII